MTGRKTGFFRFFDFSTNVATGNRKNSEFVQPQPVVRSFAVGFSSISVFFPVQRTGPANTNPSSLCLVCDSAPAHPFIITAILSFCIVAIWYAFCMKSHRRTSKYYQLCRLSSQPCQPAFSMTICSECTIAPPYLV